MVNPPFARESVLALLGRLLGHLSRRRRRQFVLLAGLTVISAAAEVVSLGIVLPFIGVLVSPELLFKRPYIAELAGSWGITSADQLVLPLTIAFVSAAVVAGAVRMLVLWVTTRLAFASSADLSIEVYRRTLYQPYPVHVSRNSSEVISSITNKIGDAVNVLYQLLTLVSSLVLLVAITATLMMINPMVAMVAIAGFGSCYFVISWIARRRLRRNSARINHEYSQVIKALQEGLGGIRDVLLDGAQEVYSHVYRQADYPLRRAQGNNVFIGASPRFVVEAVGMGLIAALAYGLSRQPGGVAVALPILGALALGAQRLLPALQLSYSAWAGITGNQTSLAGLLEMLDQPYPADFPVTRQPAPLQLRDSVEFNNVSFRYSAASPLVLDRLNLTIRKGSRVGFVGSTGSGKSTALDLLMGLLAPSEGELLVDGRIIAGAAVGAWQRSIAHVPQAIYLADTTLAENIAFGVPKAAVDMDRVRKAAAQAQIAEFIESRREGYDALVGERGVRLSGGQRQRIGIARALYKRASVLVFDEATSALDSATEQSVMSAIDGLDRELTILMIAHRFTTVRNCDTIVQLEGGKLVAQGTYDELLASSPSFQRMALAASQEPALTP